MNLLGDPFLTRALLACLLCAVPAGLVGALVVVRRETYIAGAISHCVLAGLGLARLLERGFGMSWASPMLGALVAALAAALLVARQTQKGARVDTTLSVVWSVGMALGVSFVAMTPGYQDDLMGYLFGSLLLVDNTVLAWMAVWALVVVVVMAVFYRRFLAVSFDPEAALLRGVRVARYQLLFVVLTAVTVVVLVQAAGVMLAVALLALPAATAGFFTQRLDRMMLLAVAIAAVEMAGGVALSYFPELPPGATIVEAAVVVWAISAWIMRCRKP